MTGAAVGAFGVDTGLTAGPTTRLPALIHLHADSAGALQLKALLTSTYLKEGGKHEAFPKTVQH